VEGTQLTESASSNKLHAALAVAYADLWAHYYALIRAIGMSGQLNDGRLAVDAQIVMEREGAQLKKEAKERLSRLLGQQE
jgi:hypothetical protein